MTALRKVHYAWVIVAVTFVAALTAQAIRYTPGLIIIPLEAEFGWDRATISLAVAVSLVTYGFGGPIGGGLVDRFGPKRILIAGGATIAVSIWLLFQVRELWQFFVVWGLLIGIGTGATGNVVSSAIAHRWFRTHQ
ncbi:MAG: MFS transporter, partial [Actinobacteria bacterium]|nr:MFS transporter [Actinomycetota bacterium]